jgi:probable HAF family extracellular repeat protein
MENAFVVLLLIRAGCVIDGYARALYIRAESLLPTYRKRLSMHRAFKISVVLVALLGGEAHAVSHSLNILPDAPGQTIANDMNAAGQVAANYEDNDGRHAIYAEKGKVIQLGALGGRESEARRINDKGVVVGSASRKDGSWRAFVYSRADGVQELDTLGGTNALGYSINNEGSVVGYSDLPNDDWHAFLYRPGESIKDLGTLGGKISYANAINNRGQVVGAAAIASGARHAFLYDVEHGMVDIGTLGGRASVATSINDSGVVVGTSETADRRWHAFVYDGKQMKDLGAMIGIGQSYANAINNKGHVVGTVEVGQDRLSFVWADGKINLYHGGKDLYLANAINDADQVIGATTYDYTLDAAIMSAKTEPYQDHGFTNFLGLVALILTLALCAAIGVAIYRKRYRDAELGDVSDVAWTR